MESLQWQSNKRPYNLRMKRCNSLPTLQHPPVRPAHALAPKRVHDVCRMLYSPYITRTSGKVAAGEQCRAV
jgi:hypothetical protein